MIANDLCIRGLAEGHFVVLAGGEMTIHETAESAERIRADRDAVMFTGKFPYGVRPAKGVPRGRQDLLGARFLQALMNGDAVVWVDGQVLHYDNPVEVAHVVGALGGIIVRATRDGDHFCVQPVSQRGA